MTTASSGPSLTAPTSTLTIREKLLFSQAVHKVGAGDSKWDQVGALLRECPVVNRPEDYWSDVACQKIYDALMQETGFDKLLIPAQQSQPHAEAHLYLAQHYYELRMQEIRTEIEQKEEKFRSLAVEINAIKSGEAIYNPGIMLRLRDILLDRRRAAKHKGDGSMEVEEGDLDATVPAADGDDQLKRDAEMEVEMKVGEMGENGKRTGGMALFKENEELLWRMTEGDLRLAAEGTRPLGQRKPLPPTPSPIPVPVPAAPIESTPSPPTTDTKVEFAKEDAPIQAQAPLRRLTPEPPASVDVDMDGPAPSSQPVSAGPSKRSTPVPSLSNSTRSTPQPQGTGAAVSAEIIREDAPLQAQGPPVRVAPLTPVTLPIIPPPTKVAPPISLPVSTPPATTPSKDVAPTSIAATSCLKSSGRPVPRKRRNVRKGTSPPAEENATSDVVPDSQEVPSTPPAASEVKTERPREKSVQTVHSGTKKRKADDQDSIRIEEDLETKAETVQPIVDDKEGDVDADVVPSSTAGDENRLVPERDEIAPRKHVSDQSSEDDLTPPPMSPNLPPVEDESPVTGLEPTSTPPRRRDKDEKTRKSNAAPSTRRGQNKDSREGSLPLRRRAASRGSGDELSPVPSTPVAKVQGTDTKASEAEEESQSEVEVTAKPKRARGRPRIRTTEETAAAKKNEDGEQDQGAKRTRRQEPTKRPSTRNANANKPEMSSPPSAPTKRSSRPTPERQTRTRGNRTRASKDKDEPDEPEEDGDEEEKPEGPATIRRSGRHTRAMPDLREEDENDDEDEDEDEADSAPEDTASPTATVDSDKRARPSDRRQREKEKASTKKSNKEETNKKDDQRQEDSRAAEDEAEPLDSSNERDVAEADKTSKQPLPRPSPEPAAERGSGNKDQSGPTHDETALPETKTLRTTRSVTNAITTETTTRQFRNKMNQLHQEILGHKHGPVFNAAVRPSDAPGYHDVVKKPMDLKLIKANIKSGVIRNIDDFQRDVYLMFCNAMMYNKPTSDVFQMAEEMMEWCEDKISDYKNAEALATSRS